MNLVDKVMKGIPGFDAEDYLKHDIAEVKIYYGKELKKYCQELTDKRKYSLSDHVNNVLNADGRTCPIPILQSQQSQLVIVWI